MLFSKHDVVGMFRSKMQQCALVQLFKTINSLIQDYKNFYSNRLHYITQYTGTQYTKIDSIYTNTKLLFKRYELTAPNTNNSRF